MQQNNAGDTAEAKTYPTPPNSDGFFFEDETNEALKIESKTYENGKRVMRVTLSDGTVCMLRELSAREMEINVKRLCGDNKDHVEFAMVSVATKFGEEVKTIEEIMEMRSKDFINLKVANSQINF